MKLKTNTEAIFLVIVFFMLLLCGIATLWDYRISHDFPFGYLASDNFLHLSLAQYIKGGGNFKNAPSYVSMGYEDVVGAYPPLLHHLSAIFSYVSGIEVYDTIFLLVVFFSSIGAIINYLIIRGFNKHIAILSLPLSVLMFSKNFYLAFIFGQWGALIGAFFLIASLWALSKIFLSRGYILLGILLTGAAIGHSSEFMMVIAFIIVFFLLKFILKSLNRVEIKNMIFGGVLGFILPIYYLIILKYTWAHTESIKFTTELFVFGPGKEILLKHFDILIIFILIGVILSSLCLFKSFGKKKINFALLMGLYFLLLGFSYLIGSGRRATQIRALWPIYLSVFFGLTLYHLVKLIKKWKIGYSIITGILFLILFCNIANIAGFIPYFPYVKRYTSQGLMDNYHWNALKWIEKNSQEDSKIYFFYGDIYNQKSILYATHRDSYLVQTKDFVKSLQNKEIKRYYYTIFSSDTGTHLPYRTSLFSFDFHNWTEKGKNRDICDFDYYVFDRVSREPVLIRYNMLIADELIENEFIEPVYSNDLVAILKNNKKGEDCIVEQTFE